MVAKVGTLSDAVRAQGKDADISTIELNPGTTYTHKYHGIDVSIRNATDERVQFAVLNELSGRDRAAVVWLMVMNRGLLNAVNVWESDPPEGRRFKIIEAPHACKFIPPIQPVAKTVEKIVGGQFIRVNKSEREIRAETRAAKQARDQALARERLLCSLVERGEVPCHKLVEDKFAPEERKE